MGTKEQSSFGVLMLPWLAHGHISPFLELAKKLANRKFRVYFCSTPINLNSIKKILSKSSPDLAIELVELHLPSSSELPPHYHTTNGLPPHLMVNLIQAFEMASSSLSNILNSLHPHLVIYDIYQTWVPQLALEYRIPAIHFQTTGATAAGFFLRLFKHRGVEFPSPAIFLRESEISKMSRVDSTIKDGKDKDRVFGCIDGSFEAILIKSCREFEGKYIDFLSFLTKKRVIPVGSLVQEHVQDNEHSEIIQWLDEKPRGSSVFVSFGSECFLSKEEIEEIAYGLDNSNVNFIWVIRFPDGEQMNLEKALPDRFLDKVKGKGLIVEGWAPQAKILAHSSIGGFVCHCGWGSVMESISFGVPIIAVPMQLDQPLNARLVVEAGVGIEVIRDEKGMLNGEDIARVVKQVVMEGTGEDVRGKARELREMIQSKADEEIDDVVEQLRQICISDKHKK